MNSLSRTHTARFFTDSQSYYALRRHWSRLMNSERRRELSAAHHLLYLALIGKDWRKGFSPMTSRRKLDNGAFFDWGLFRALARFHSPYYQADLLAVFDSQVTPEVLAKVRQHVPCPSPLQYTPDDFLNATFPFDAYNLAQA